MGLFDRFRNRNDSAVLPEDVDSYYRDDRSSRRSAALLLGLATFVATLLIGSTLYFGGRAVYRAISGDDGQDNVVQVEENGQKHKAEKGRSQGQEAGSDSAEEGQSQSEARRNGNDRNQQRQRGNTTPALGDQRLPATGDPGM